MREQRVNFEAIEALEGGLDRVDEFSEVIIRADVGPSASPRPLVDLGGTSRVLPARKRRAIVTTPAQVVTLRTGDV